MGVVSVYPTSPPPYPTLVHTLSSYPSQHVHMFYIPLPFFPIIGRKRAFQQHPIVYSFFIMLIHQSGDSPPLGFSAAASPPALLLLLLLLLLHFIYSVV